MGLSKHRRWVFGGVIVICVAIAGELLLRVFGFGNPILVAPNQLTNYELLPDQSIRRMWPLSDSWVAHVRTNHHGMRSDEISDSKPAGVLRLYFLGDSYTYGTTQIDQEQIFTALLQHDLPAIVHMPVEVMNGSISGWAISNELAYLQEHGTLHADRVILVLNQGDPGQPKALLPNSLVIPSTLHHPRSGYEEFWFRGVIPELYRLQTSLGIHWFSVARPVEDPGLEASGDKKVIEQNLAYLTQMSDYVASQGCEFSIVFIGKDADYDTRVRYAETTTGKNAIIGWTKEHQVPFVDVEAALGGHLGNSVLLRDHSHPNVVGARRIATEIEQDWSALTHPQSNSQQVMH
jgi:lysophospholipase L1-like esterase